MPKLLLVDDSIVARMSLKACLPKDEHELVECEDGSRAIELFQTEHPDVTFMDLTMPGVDGMQALQEIMTVAPQATVIILTADTQRKTIDQALKLGAFAVVKKPPTRDDVLAELEKALAAQNKPQLAP